MHVRRNINLLLQRSHYQIVKVFAPGESDAMPPEVLLDDQVLGSRIALERKHAWIVAAPKSGSTWLSALLEDLLGWRAVGLSGGSCRREQEPDLRQIIRFPTENILSPHQHCRASDCTVQFIKRFRIKSILQVRNIYDTIISFRDHCRTEGLVFPMAYIDREFLRLSDEQQFQFIIDLVLPWYFNFYASWFEVEGLGPDNLFYVTYEDLRQDPRPVLNQILDYLVLHGL